jgi:TonB family protein
MLRRPTRRAAIVAALLAMILALSAAVASPPAASADTIETVARVLGTTRHRRAFLRCYTRERRANAFELADSYTKLVVRFTIDETGRPRQLRVEQATTPALDACMLAALRRVRFPATGRRHAVRHPFIFG